MDLGRVAGKDRQAKLCSGRSPLRKSAAASWTASPASAESAL